MKYRIRSEKVSDITAINEVITSAFSGNTEAEIVSNLRDRGALTFSLVAECEDDEKIVAHLAFSMVLVESRKQPGKVWQTLAMAPVSVLPEFQGKGVASDLIDFWFQEYADAFYKAVFLLGSPEFYSRFGFEAALKFHFFSDFTNEGGFFQVKALDDSFLNIADGDVYYQKEFYASSGC